MTGQKSFSKAHNGLEYAEPGAIRALQGLSEDNLGISTFSHTRIEKGYAPLLYHVGCSRNEASRNQEDLYQKGSCRSEGRLAVYFSLVSPLSLDQNPDSKYKPVFQQTKRPFFGGSIFAVNPIFHGSHAEHYVNVPTARIT